MFFKMLLATQLTKTFAKNLAAKKDLENIIRKLYSHVSYCCVVWDMTCHVTKGGAVSTVCLK